MDKEKKDKYAYSYVRFSSERQQQGDSVRRQLALASAYALKHDLILDTHSYRDLGISAFSGRNAIEGKLGTFLKAVDDGVIKPGSYLLVESLDRISRAQVDEALELFLSIIRRGIIIVTLLDEQVYSRERIRQDKGISLIVSLTFLVRAHEESATQSTRVKAAWDNKRVGWKPGDRLISGMGPAWLKAAPDNRSWIQLPDKVAIIQRIYKLSAEGVGQVKITNTLNAERVPTMEDAQFWTQGVVGALLRNPSVMGTYTQKKGGTQVIEDYFPAVVPKDQWLFVQNAVKSRRSKGGTKSDKISNLFSGMSYCLYCGSRTRFVATYKHYAYIQCLKSHSKGSGCNAAPFPYRAAETAVLHRLMIGQLRTLDNRLDFEEVDRRVIIDQEIEGLKARQKKAIELMLLLPDVTPLTTELKALQVKIDGLEAEKRALTTIVLPTKEELDSALQLYRQHEKLIAEGSSPELAELRRSMQAALRRELKQLQFGPNFLDSTLYADNAHPLSETETRWLKWLRNKPPSPERDAAIAKLAGPSSNGFFSDKRSSFHLSDAPDFIIQLTFTSGKVRVVDASPLINERSKAKRRARRTAA